jgi:DNA-binding NarL/FixJ family response regulator
MGMTSNGRSSGPDEADAANREQPDKTARKSSGVFRAARGEARLGGRWSIAEEYVQDGYQYRLLRRPVATSAAPRLTKREEAALELALAGHGNKTIAQLLVVSPSTVGVLLFRAATKLDVTSRSELLLAYQALKESVAPAPAETEQKQPDE